MSQGFVRSNITVNPVAVSGSNGSLTFDTLSLGNLNGLSFYTSLGSLVGSYTVPSGASLNVSAGTTSNNLTAITFSNSNGVTFGLNGSVITGSHNGITSQSVQAAVGLNTAQTNVTWTVNSSGISFNAGAYLTTAMASNAVTLSNIKVSAGTLSALRSDISFNDSNGITFGLETNGIITATVKTDYQSSGNYLTTAMASNRGSDFVQATAAFAGTNASGTIASDGISISVNANAGIAIKGSGAQSQSTGTVEFANSNGITFGLSNNGTMTASHNGLTSQSVQPAVGLNTAQTNVTWTVNSSGISIDAAGYAGTGTSESGAAAFTLNSNGLAFNANSLAGVGTSATNASVTLNSNGLAISVASPAAGIAIAASTRTATTAGSLLFDTGNGITFGLNAVGGSIMTASHNGLTNIKVSAGTSSANLSDVTFSNSNGLSFGLNGSTITASAARLRLYDWDNFGVIQTMNQITNLTATGVTQRPMFFPLVIPGDITWNRGMFELSKVTNSQNYQFTFQFAIYSFANSTSINLIASLQNVYDLSSASSVSITGIRRFAFDGIQAAGSTITPGHYVGMYNFSAGAGGTSGINASLRGGLTANPPLGFIGKGTNALSTANLSTIYLRQFQGLYSTTSGAAPAAVPLADIRGWTTGGVPYVLLQST